MPNITPDLFQTYLELIRSGQIPQEDVPKLLQENPEFAKWYRERIPRT